MQEKNQSEKIYLLMNKPSGYVCKAMADQNKTVFELLPEELQTLVQGAKRGERLHTVGRLDRDTTGLLLITNDGKFSHLLTAPEYAVEKQYLVTLESPVTVDEQKVYCARAAEGIVLPAEKKAAEERASAARIEFEANKNNVSADNKNNVSADSNTSSCCTITITEGKFHEVRRIFSALGNKVLRLKRVRLGTLHLDQFLTEGAVRPLTSEEICRLMQRTEEGRRGTKV